MKLASGPRMPSMGRIRMDGQPVATSLDTHELPGAIARHTAAGAHPGLRAE
jgi:hypothetical protein